MNKITVILILVFLAVLLVSLYIAKNRVNTPSVKVFQFNSLFSNYHESENIMKPFDELGFYPVKRFYDANFVLFADYTMMDQNIDSIQFKKDMTIYGFKGMDLLANKGHFGRRMRNTSYVPTTYLIADGEFPTEKGTYILKQNVQRQEGILITKDLDYIREKAVANDYVVAQDIITDVYLVNKRKINMRVYVMLIIKGNQITWHAYNDGFVYYTPEFYDADSTDNKHHITTGYIDRSVYESNPLTHQDLYNYLGYHDAEKLKKSLMSYLKAVKEVYSDELVKENASVPGLKVNILGFDVSPTSNLGIIGIEVNKGPSLTYMDKRDKEVKLGLVKNAMHVIGALPEGEKKMFTLV